MTAKLLAWGFAARRTARRGGAGASAAVTRVRSWAAGPPVAVALGSAFVGIVVVSIGLRTVLHAYDEDLFKQSAVHYASDGEPRSLFHDVFARGSARLYPLLLAPLFRAFDGDVAVRASHLLSAAMFLSAAVPAYLLAAAIVRSRWLAAGAAVMSVALPWVALATTVYSENLAYPLFLWTLLAMWHALDRPSAHRDALVLAAIFALGCTRVQFATLFVPWVALVVIREAAGRWSDRLRFDRWGAARQLVRAYPVTSSVLALITLAVVVRAGTGHLHEDVQRVLGGYSEIQDRSQLGQNFTLAVAAEILAVVFGIGIVPAVVGAAWYAKAATGDIGERARDFALLILVVSVPTILLTVYAQGGYLAYATEERYFFYFAPLLWIGAFAAFEGRAVTRRALWVAGAFAVLAVGAIDITTEANNVNYMFLAPVHTTLANLAPAWLQDIGRRNHLLGTLAPRDLRVLLAFAGVVATALLWRSPRGRAIALGLAVVVQLGFVGYAMAGLDGRVPGMSGRTGTGFANLGWVDRHVPGGVRVAWLDNQAVTDLVTAHNHQVDTTFYNDEVRRLLVVPALRRPEADVTLLGQPTTPISVGRGGTLTLGGPVDSAYVITAVDSPVLQIGGRPVATSPDGSLALVRLHGRVAASWRADGLAGDGWLEAHRRAALRLLASGPHRVTLTLRGPPLDDGSVRVGLGDVRRTISLPSGQTREVSATLCGPTEGTLTAVEASPFADGSSRRVAAALIGADVKPAAAGACPRG